MVFFGLYGRTAVLALVVAFLLGVAVGYVLGRK